MARSSHSRAPCLMWSARHCLGRDGTVTRLLCLGSDWRLGVRVGASHAGTLGLTVHRGGRRRFPRTPISGFGSTRPVYLAIPDARGPPVSRLK
ncbi:hypothetical protein GCM10023168_33880 [Fodinibacter luteus]|uniref:Uncharacterized protein n=1 Tax=Fodinibacter luteus TaxID=552064 RepID=A0ABP8KQZ4_9MICO